MFDRNTHENKSLYDSWIPPATPDTDLLGTVQPPLFRAKTESIHKRPVANLAPKILLYSHDTFGLGNIKRTLLLAQNFVDQYPEASILVITGSPIIHAFRMPRGVDYVKLPSVDRVSAEKYEPLSLLHCGNEVRLARSGMVTNIVTSFRPDLLVVDKRAAGINGELVESLRYLKKESPKTKIVLGIRDILDAPKHTSRVLRENGSFNIIEEFYHEVWIYGSSEIFDSAQEYDFPANVRLKTRYCGYLQRPTSERRISSKDIRVLVTTGGGGDGSRMIETYLACLPRLRAKLSVSSTIVFGPQIDTARRDELYARYSDLQYVKFLDFEPDLTQRYSDADVVVSMAGYNTVCELLSHKKKAVLVPRSEPVQEQLIRARLLADHGLFQMIEPADLSPQTMMDKIITAAKTPSQSMRRLDLDGLTRIRGRVRDLLKDQRA